MEQAGNRTEVRMALTFVNIDAPAERETIYSIGYGVDTSDKGPGMAISYATKYGLLKAFMLETGEDSDAHNIAHEPAPRPPRQQSAPPAIPHVAATPSAEELVANSERAAVVDRIKTAAKALDLDNKDVAADAIKAFAMPVSAMNATQREAFARRLEQRVELRGAEEKA